MATGERGREILNRDEADALARQYAEGHILTPTQREEYLKRWVEEHFDATGYSMTSDVSLFMQEKGLTTYESEADPNIVTQTVCEEQAARKCRHLTGPDLDECYWGYMRECSPVRSNWDPTIPQSPVEEGIFKPKIYSLPSRGRR